MHADQQRLFLFIDGLGETKEPTSLGLARHPHLDSLTNNSTAGFFIPIVLERQRCPKTDVNIPFFFLLDPEDFVGRGALELIDMEVPLTLGYWTCEARVGLLSDTTPQPWLASGASDTYIQLLHDLVDSFGGGDNGLFISPFSSHQNKLIIYVPSKECGYSLINRLRSFLAKHNAYLETEDFYLFKRLTCSSRRTYFGGWAYGALRGFFKAIGATVNSFLPPLFDYSSRERNLERMINTAEDIFQQFDDVVFYIKDTDKASHLNNRTLKIQAIEFADSILGRLLAHSPRDVMVAVISDHPTDVGSWESSPLPSPFLISPTRETEARVSEGWHFCEEQIRERGSYLSAKALRAIMYGE